ncbi:HAD family hydrolase [Microbacterium sp. BWT-B31]|uniref:HAD family hydrolase n=1 Tax=Microbacterium sp. BWT-B31 TaxID=3232072 RepID=UPI003527C350
MTHTIVFDFDGTLALGAGPIVAFAHAVAERAGDDGFVARALTALAEFEAGETDHRDGYDVVGSLASAQGVPEAELSAAYDASRALLGTAAAEVHAPAGLAPFLARVGARARLLLATNAPGESIVPILTRWGVVEAFDALHFTVGKPAGLVPILEDALASGPVLSVGDIVEFDLAPAMSLGAATALVGVTAERAAAPVTLRGRTLADLYTDIEAWAAAAASSPSDTHPLERHI